MKKHGYLIALVLAIVPVLVIACTTQVSGEGGALTEEQARQKAEEFVKDCPTFMFDGVEDSFVLEETLYPDIENAWTFIYTFDSLHSGYGGRDGQMLLQVITPHEAMITVENGEIKTALMDGRWDMLNQQLIS
ncbi:MAG: hypothetical protein PHQ10_06720 [Dehalococcoidales bacterium]|jgi:hypothetical protein|nr:hypothetical protein [Dehalococcoidales bacterium]MDD3265056.1 hypothetical protein [Dehalococcoidales bacterium]MDD4323171.1 hypothetical protein [Dehalococcoidales bacterium]MDD4794909.1 hypothetical protein [Dehalococcoidales bacterium]MDD5499128.1 hypothetical protein [Dehalococcoidales bacterium]